MVNLEIHMKRVCFSYNAVTKNLVIAIKIPALTIDIPKIIITYRRPGKESIVKSDAAYVIFGKFLFNCLFIICYGQTLKCGKT